MSTVPPDADRRVDATGLLCPEPVMMLHNALREMQAGEVVELVSTDPSSDRDVRRLSEFLLHPLLHTAHDNNVYRFWIRKKNRSEDAPVWTNS